MAAAMPAIRPKTNLVLMVSSIAVASGQREHDQGLAARRGADGGAATRHYRDILFATLAPIGDRDSIRGVIELHRPQFFTGLRIESAKTVVVGSAKEYKTAAR